jgi:hypothetical protein
MAGVDEPLVLQVAKRLVDDEFVCGCLRGGGPLGDAKHPRCTL